MDKDKPLVRIAVVDDDHVLLGVFSSLMKKTGYHPHYFLDAPTALAKISAVRGHFHLVISDVRMPGMDGIEFATRVRAVEPNIPIIFMTGDVTEESRQAALKLGHVVFLEKPFPLESTLKEFIPKLLKGEI